MLKLSQNYIFYHSISVTGLLRLLDALDLIVTDFFLSPFIIPVTMDTSNCCRSAISEPNKSKLVDGEDDTSDKGEDSCCIVDCKYK